MYSPFLPTVTLVQPLHDHKDLDLKAKYSKTNFLPLGILGLQEERKITISLPEKLITTTATWASAKAVFPNVRAVCVSVCKCTRRSERF